jgi:hypothetical protein
MAGFFLCGGVNQYARLLGLFTMQGDTDFKDKGDVVKQGKFP